MKRIIVFLWLCVGLLPKIYSSEVPAVYISCDNDKQQIRTGEDVRLGIKTLSTMTQKVYWNFGDGTTDEGMFVRHSYNFEGIYKVKVEVNGIIDSLKIIVNNNTGNNNILKKINLKEGDGVFNEFVILILGDKSLWGDFFDLHSQIMRSNIFKTKKIMAYVPSDWDISNYPYPVIKQEKDMFKDIDTDDMTWVHILSHGTGIINTTSSKDQKYNGLFFTRPRVTNNGSYKESDLKLLALHSGGFYMAPLPLGKKRLYFEKNAVGSDVYGVMAVKSIKNLVLADGRIINDNDPFVEIIKYYAECDKNKNAILDSFIDEWPNNYDEPITNIPFEIIDNYQSGDFDMNGVPDTIFAINDSILAIDLNNDNGANLTADGIDINNDGFFEKVDFNQDGDTSDNVEIPLKIILDGRPLYEYELAESLPPGLLTLHCCNSGGFLNSSPVGVASLCACPEGELAGRGIRNLTMILADLIKKGDLDGNRDDFISAVEIANGSYNFMPQPEREMLMYNDQGDRSSGVSLLLPKDAYGFVGQKIGFWIDANQTKEKIPYYFQLAQNYPNPFNPTTVIDYLIPVQTKVTLTVYNINGQEIMTLVNANQPAGNYTIQFDGTKLPSGVYFYKITAGNFTQTKKMNLLK